MSKPTKRPPLLGVHVPTTWVEGLDRLVERRRVKDPGFRRSDAVREAIRLVLEREDVAA